MPAQKSCKTSFASCEQQNKSWSCRCWQRQLWMYSMSEMYSSARLAHSPQHRVDDCSDWSELPAEVLQLVARLLPSAGCWALRSVATGWAAAVRSCSDIQLTVHSEVSKIKSKFAHARTLQSRYPHASLAVSVITPLEPLECINLLRVLKYQVNTVICKKQQQQAPRGKHSDAGIATYSLPSGGNLGHFRASPEQL